ncbi:Membrane-bound lytic murein transglycosylase B [Actinokineospora terrae]|uniref:Membrane-bound lytic murein transglycosylase B n=1 Tax=Actinokineospora terrae TaxID=155974 RepID=A0A1H9NWB9_9PSEU|nr:Membrane-bound lytic murein transglycosylase B [Actinokineospora terrae]
MVADSPRCCQRSGKREGVVTPSQPGGARPVTALALVLLSLATAAAQASGPAQPPANAAPIAITPARDPAPAAAEQAGSSTPQLLAGFPAVGPVTQLPAPMPVERVEAQSPVTSTGVPSNMLDAYRKAERLAPRACGLKWYHLAAIGRVESGHAAGGRADDNGDTAPRILGPVLSGSPGIAAIPDTDGGELDGDTTWDRAVGPMQFIPSTWRKYAADGNGDGVRSPHNIYDAAVAAGRYLCSGGMDLNNVDDLGAAIFRYNHSGDYVVAVTTWLTAYSGGVTPIPPAPPVEEAPVVAVPEQPPSPSPEPAPTTSQPPSETPAPTETSVPSEPPSTEPSEPPDPSDAVAPTETTEAAPAMTAGAAPAIRPARPHRPHPNRPGREVCAEGENTSGAAATTAPEGDCAAG